MNNYMIPTDDAFIEHVAKSIARGRLNLDAADTMRKLTGVELNISESLEETFDRVFELLWAVTTEHDNKQRESYRKDARAAIGAINLKLLTSLE